MSSRTYWLDLFTGTTWQEFKDNGGTVSGFRASRWKTVQKIRPGDYLLCYLTGLSRFIAVLEVTSEPFQDSTPIWKDEAFPCRLRVKPVVELIPETAVPVLSMKDSLSVFQNTTSSIAWTGHFRGSPTRWKQTDGESVFRAITAAKENPVSRPFDPRKLARRPKSMPSTLGAVTIPENDIDSSEEIVTAKAATEHTEIQALLLKLGSDMGFRVWVARNDKNREALGLKFSTLPSVCKDIPRQFDDATSRIIEMIDVLWLDGNAIIAAFEIESTTSIYSGLLRMADLVAMQPNLNIPLYLVAPYDRRDKVLSEVNRPTFSRLRPKLSEMCRYIAFEALKEQMLKIAPIIQYLKPTFLDELSEPCEVDEL